MRSSSSHYSSSSSSPPSRAAAAATATSSSRPTLRHRLPPGSWDSHVHVFDLARYPLAPNAPYKPAATKTADDLVAFESTALGIRHAVLVQMSVHGTDNRNLLDELRALGGPQGHARAVVVINPDPTAPSTAGGVDDATLAAWHALGVRGVRVNFSSHLASQGASASGSMLAPVPAQEELQKTVRALAARVAPFGWAVQLYLPLTVAAQALGGDFCPRLAEELAAAGRRGGRVASTATNPDPDPNPLKLVIDHCGDPDLRPMRNADPYTIPGFSTLVALLRTETTWVKISAPYRAPGYDYDSASTSGPGPPAGARPEDRLAAFAPVVRELLSANRRRVVFASDWPHTCYEDVDIRPFVDLCWKLCGDAETRELLFRRNAEELWGVRSGGGNEGGRE